MAAVLKEIRQRKRFESRGEEAVVTLLRTADRVSGSMRRIVTGAGLSLQQYNVLRILRGAGAEGLPTLDIATRMIEHCPGVTRLVDRLVAAGLVVRGRGNADRRQVVCRVTAEGKTLLASLDKPVRTAADRCLAPLGQGGIGEFVRLLDLARAAAEEAATGIARKSQENRGESR